jgi:hypothetical protein
MDEVKLPVELFNKITSYLGNRPYMEVYQLVAEIAKAIEDQGKLDEK